MANLPSANLRSWDVSNFKVFSQNLGCFFHEITQLVDGLLGSFLRLEGFQHNQCRVWNIMWASRIRISKSLLKHSQVVENLLCNCSFLFCSIFTFTFSSTFTFLVFSFGTLPPTPDKQMSPLQRWHFQVASSNLLPIQSLLSLLWPPPSPQKFDRRFTKQLRILFSIEIPTYKKNWDQGVNIQPCIKPVFEQSLRSS